jgi:hypothetical protein
MYTRRDALASISAAASFAAVAPEAFAADSIWFTDPPFGILGNYEGHMGDAEATHECVPARSEIRPRNCGDGRRQSAERACLLAR